MIKKLLVVITLVTVVVACGDKKKDNTETPQYAGVDALVESADSLVALDEVTLVGKLGLCPVTKEDLVLAGKGTFVKVVLAEGVNVDTLLYGKGVAVVGKLSVEVLDEEAIAAVEAKLAECKAACDKAKEEKVAEEKVAEDATAEPKEGCCANKEKSCCSAPKVGDKVYTITVTKVEEFECPNKDKCCKEGEEATEEQKSCEEQK